MGNENGFDMEVEQLIVDQKGDIVKDPMKSIPFVPKTIPGVGWGVACRGGVGHVEGVGWVM